MMVCVWVCVCVNVCLYVCVLRSLIQATTSFFSAFVSCVCVCVFLVKQTWAQKRPPDEIRMLEKFQRAKANKLPASTIADFKTLEPGSALVSVCVCVWADRAEV